MTTENLLKYCNDKSLWDGDDIQHKTIDDYPMICIPGIGIVLSPSSYFHVAVNQEYRGRGYGTKLVNSIYKFGYKWAHTSYEEEWVKEWLKRMGFHHDINRKEMKKNKKNT